MDGLSYSVKKNFTFTKTELYGLFWTSIAFAFIITFRKWGTGKNVDIGAGIVNLFLAFIVVIICMWLHVAIQKIIAIRLGYKATYSYWLNGVLLSLFLAFVSLGYIIFILPGSVMLEAVPSLRLGKFRFGMNLKDIARVALAGPMLHIVLIMVFGSIYFLFGRPEFLVSVIGVNAFLAFYSILPIPKIDVPTKMDAGSDGLGLFYFSRTLYVLTALTILIYIVFVMVATSVASLAWLFVLSFILGCILTAIYVATLEEK